MITETKKERERDIEQRKGKNYAHARETRECMDESERKRVRDEETN